MYEILLPHFTPIGIHTENDYILHSHADQFHINICCMLFNSVEFLRFSLYIKLMLNIERPV
jgi:hypothetical protein